MRIDYPNQVRHFDENSMVNSIDRGCWNDTVKTVSEVPSNTAYTGKPKYSCYESNEEARRLARLGTENSLFGPELTLHRNT